MRRLSHLAAVAAQRFELARETGGDIDVALGDKGRRLLRGLPLGAGWDLESVDRLDAAVRQWPACGNHRAVHYAMIYIEVAAVMGVDDARPDARQEAFNGLHHVEQGDAVQLIVGKTGEHGRCRADDFHCPPCARLSLAKLCLALPDA